MVLHIRNIIIIKKYFIFNGFKYTHIYFNVFKLPVIFY